MFPDSYKEILEAFMGGAAEKMLEARDKKEANALHHDLYRYFNKLQEAELAGEDAARPLAKVARNLIISRNGPMILVRQRVNPTDYKEAPVEPVKVNPNSPLAREILAAIKKDQGQK